MGEITEGLRHVKLGWGWGGVFSWAKSRREVEPEVVDAIQGTASCLLCCVDGVVWYI